MLIQKEAIIEVRQLKFRYPGAKAYSLNGVNLEIAKGDFIAIIGQNGAGKTTLTKHFNGLYLPTEGDILISGQNTKHMKTNKIIRLVGYCYQNPDHQLFSRTVYDEVAYGPKNLGFTPAQTKEKAKEALEVVKLSDKTDSYPFTLGRGERQRLAIASVISMGSPILIVDEPTTGLDTKGIKQIMDFLRDWNEAGHTVIVVTHDIAMVADYVPRTIVMANGNIIANGMTREVLQDKEILAQAYVKQPQIVRLATELSSSGIPKSTMTVSEMYQAITSIQNSGKSAERGIERAGGL